ncbi:hypothetical protein Dsin_016703 [Dipteronia sinensis]|uniref:Uncharacterized protein n=1 Tax=Dipteronia sinensis TaxID=43782 RepID=A0AAE0AEX9_9ROSI|nr:hypothetical protein Dsin_016703 [Dipteronia sinensis]
MRKVEVEDFEQLVEELEHALPLEIMDKTLENFGNDFEQLVKELEHGSMLCLLKSWISGAEDVALIEYVHLSGRTFRLGYERLNQKHINYLIELRNRSLCTYFQAPGHECACEFIALKKLHLNPLRAMHKAMANDCGLHQKSI